MSELFKCAEKMITGVKREAYGPVHESFQALAMAWSAIMGHDVSPAQVCLCMIMFKCCRESNKHNVDNIVDIYGYTLLLENLRDVKFPKTAGEA